MGVEVTPEDVLGLAGRLRERAAPGPEASWTLGNSRLWLMERVDDGVSCPCCSRYVKRYRRSLTRHMADWLIALYRLAPPGHEWVHSKKVFSFLARNGFQRGSNAADYNYLVHWGLTEPAPTKEIEVEDGRKPGRSGFWRTTETGRQFVLGNTTVRQKVVTLAGALEGFDGDPISIHQALADQFDYNKLMSAHLAVEALRA
jgi:hypothetical protein